MEVRASNKNFLQWEGDALAIGLFEDATELSGELVTLDEKLGGILKELITEEEFKAKASSSIFTRVAGVSKKTKVQNLRY